MSLSPIGEKWVASAPGPGLRALYELCDTKRRHAADVTVRRGPSGALESRTWTVPGAIATSTQSFPSPLLL